MTLIFDLLIFQMRTHHIKKTPPGKKVGKYLLLTCNSEEGDAVYSDFMAIHSGESSINRYHLSQFNS